MYNAKPQKLSLNGISQFPPRSLIVFYLNTFQTLFLNITLTSTTLHSYLLIMLCIMFFTFDGKLYKYLI